MHHAPSSHSRSTRRLLVTLTAAFLASVAASCSNGDAESDDAPDVLAFNPEAVETVEGLWIEAGASEPLAACYSAVLRDAGALADPVETMSDLAAAHNSLTPEEQDDLDSCLTSTAPTAESAEVDTSNK